MLPPVHAGGAQRGSSVPGGDFSGAGGHSDSDYFLFLKSAIPKREKCGVVGKKILRKMLCVKGSVARIAETNFWIMSTDEFLIYDFEQQGPFWHLCTPGDLGGLLFREAKDFVYGMNLVAHAAALHESVDIYTFVIMNNHLHFVLRG